MTSADLRSYDRLSQLEKVSLKLLKEVFDLISNDDYMDLLEDLVETSDLDLETEEGNRAFSNRVDSAEEKVAIRTARALLNYYTDKSDRLALMATRGVD